MDYEDKSHQKEAQKEQHRNLSISGLVQPEITVTAPAIHPSVGKLLSVG